MTNQDLFFFNGKLSIIEDIIEDAKTAGSFCETLDKLNQAQAELINARGMVSEICLKIEKGTTQCQQTTAQN